ncbi:unnamed protein product [Cylicostephanus goldi]|uniref:Uncharacterized protein n=1 Tax=Cylicostephanus goldi TaxID=71465 RepID=A0A3P6UPI0_CYLGO|nr:unnamed protein product [Cylicostephanus goldi]
MVSPDEGFDSDEEIGPTRTLTKKEQQELERRRLKNKKKKLSKRHRKAAHEEADAVDTVTPKEEKPDEQDGEVQGPKNATEDLEVEIDYVGETPKLDEKDPNFQYFSAIFSAFKIEPTDENGEPLDGAVSSGVVHKKDEEYNRASMSEKILQEEINVNRLNCSCAMCILSIKYLRTN